MQKMFKEFYMNERSDRQTHELTNPFSYPNFESKESQERFFNSNNESFSTLKTKNKKHSAMMSAGVDSPKVMSKDVS